MDIIKESLIISAETINEVWDIIQKFKKRDDQNKKITLGQKIGAILQLTDNTVEIPMLLMNYDEYQADFKRISENEDYTTECLEAFAKELNQPPAEVEEILLQAIKTMKEIGKLVSMIVEAK